MTRRGSKRASAAVTATRRMQRPAPGLYSATRCPDSRSTASLGDPAFDSHLLAAAMLRMPAPVASVWDRRWVMPMAAGCVSAGGPVSTRAMILSAFL